MAVVLLFKDAKTSIEKNKATRKCSTEQIPVIYIAMARVSKPGLS